MFTLTIQGKELKEDTDYDLNKTDLKEEHPMFPLKSFIINIQKNKTEEAKKFITSEYLKYAKDQLQGGYPDYFTRNYVTKLDPKKPTTFRFYKINQNTYKIIVAYTTKESYSATKKFFVSNKSGKWKINK